MANNTNTKYSTKEKILKYAIKEFLEYGFYGARMQRIADKAKINKAMLFYYYKNKKQIYKEALMSIFKTVVENLINISDEDVPIEDKIKEIIDIYADFASKNPDYLRLVQYEFSRGGKDFTKYNILKDVSKSQLFPLNPDTGKIFKYFNKKMKSGEIRNINLAHLIISIAGQVMASFFARPLFEAIGVYKPSDFDKFIKERKEFIVKLVLDGIRGGN
ncbi:MAG: TetR/AcrR family transcriptional regulator [bacterium]|nr:TetR/AcrR family transcriptional regulator [bacterium]